MKHSSPHADAVRRNLLHAVALTSLPVLWTACLDRPVVPATPTVTARVAQPVKQTAVKGIDLLFMIDNSSSMADKQAILADAVPALLDRLTNPDCVDPATGHRYGSPSGGKCAKGELEFNPVSDMHIGIVTSSLGSRGVEGACEDVASDPTSHNNDKGQLVTREASGNVNAGFLNWTSDASDATSTFQAMVKGVRQHGCGYESQLEAPYRFLIDPKPPASVHLGKDSGGRDVIVAEGVDETILSQRADFLRPDSLVTVIMVSDENDCSLQDYGQAWMVIASPEKYPHAQVRPGTNPCNTNPNDPCCYNCGQDPPPKDCPAPDTYSNCVKDGEPVYYEASENPANLRCWDQKRRYGMDFLYGVDRYIKGFTETTITDREGHAVQNPLFDDLTCPVGASGCTRKGARDKALVFVAGIVGVPWQDIANNPTDPSSGFKTTGPDFPWDVILGDPTANPPVPPADPLMIESVEPRAAQDTKNPVGGSALPDRGFDHRPDSNPVNGHEWDTSEASPPRSDLQYACVFKLPEPRDCANQTGDCDCMDNSSKGGTAPKDYKSPLCQDDSGRFGTSQYRAKGYPGIRELQMLKGIGSQAIVASVCPAVVTGDKKDASYGYNPAVQTLINRLKEALRGKCLPRSIAPNGDGTYPCIVYEGFDPSDGVCDCEHDPKYQGRVADHTRPEELPDTLKGHKCVCQIQQLTDEDKVACQTVEDLNQVQAVGWCYVDPNDKTLDDPHAACSIVKSCPATDRRIIRFAGTNHMGEPRPGADAVILCQEASFTQDDGRSVGTDPCSHD